MSERKKQGTGKQGRLDDLHRFRNRNVKLTGNNVNVMSICGSTYCLSERRSMELCAFVELDLKACLDFSCVYRFHSTLAVLL